MWSQQVMTRAVYVIAALVLIAACANGNNSQSRQVGDYSITVTTDPPQLQVGSDAEVTAHIVKDGEGLEKCRTGFRQYMPDHQMTTDHAMHAMKDLGQGEYRARGSEFSMGGDWEVEIQFNCGDGLKTVVFTYQLVWM